MHITSPVVIHGVRLLKTNSASGPSRMIWPLLHLLGNKKMSPENKVIVISFFTAVVTRLPEWDLLDKNITLILASTQLPLQSRPDETHFTTIRMALRCLVKKVLLPQLYASSREKCIFIIQLTGVDECSEEVNDAVGIDCSRKLALDLIEVHLLQPDRKSLGVCFGDGFRFAGVMEISELVEQEKGKRNRKRSRRRNGASQRDQQERKRKRKLDS